MSGIFSVIRTKKFWALVSDVVKAASGLAVGELDAPQFAEAIISAGARYLGPDAPAA